MSKILAVITMNKENVAGGAPIFVANSEEEKKRTAFLLEKILNASVHDLKNGSMIVVQHGGGGD
jgi:hypothetical protein